MVQNGTLNINGFLIKDGTLLIDGFLDVNGTLSSCGFLAPFGLYLYYTNWRELARNFFHHFALSVSCNLTTASPSAR